MTGSTGVMNLVAGRVNRIINRRTTGGAGSAGMTCYTVGRTVSDQRCMIAAMATDRMTCGRTISFSDTVPVMDTTQRHGIYGTGAGGMAGVTGPVCRIKGICCCTIGRWNDCTGLGSKVRLLKN